MPARRIIVGSFGHCGSQRLQIVADAGHRVARGKARQRCGDNQELRFLRHGELLPKWLLQP
jgi:hypothetical protein